MIGIGPLAIFLRSTFAHALGDQERTQEFPFLEAGVSLSLSLSLSLAGRTPSDLFVSLEITVYNRF